MQYPQPESYHPNPSSMNDPHQPSPSSNQPQPAQARPDPSPGHSTPHFQTSHPHGYPSEPYHHPHYTRYGRGGFFGPWFNHHLTPPAPPATAPRLPPSYLPPSCYNQHHYRFYRRCGRRGGLLPLLIVGGAGYYAYRKLETKIEGVRSEVSNDQHHLVSNAIDSRAPHVDFPRVPQADVNEKGLVPSSVDENEAGKHWGWHGGRRFREREAERKRGEDDRRRSEFEMKMKEWEEAVRQEKERKENSRWI